MMFLSDICELFKIIHQKLGCLSNNHYICEIINYYYQMAKINRLKIVLVEKEKTSKWLAETLGKDPATVSKWCTNTTQPSIETFLEIARLLEVDIKDLLVESDVNKQFLH